MRNILINGDFQIWQRGTKFWPNERHLQYTADRWNVDWRHPYDDPKDDIPPLVTKLGVAKISRQPFPLGQTEVPGGPKYFLRWEQRTPSSSSNWFRDLSQQIDDVSTFAGQQVTLSCYLRANRPATIKLVTEQFFGGSKEEGASEPAFTETDPPLIVTTAWQRYSYSPILESVAGKSIVPSGNDSLNFIVSQKGSDAIEPLTLDIADCQLELGPTLTPFERRTFSDQLAAAERYFQKSYTYDDPPGKPNAWASSLGLLQAPRYDITSVHLRRGMRRAPQVFLFNPWSGATGSWRSVVWDVRVGAMNVGTNYFTVVTSEDFGEALQNRPLAGHWVADAEFAWSEWW